MAIPVWFDTAHYKAQKLAQLMATDSNGAWTAPKLDSVMESAGFSGNEGWFAHFTQYGADEHCSPNATFNAAEYLTAKLAQLKATDPLWNGKSVGDVQAAFKAAGLGEWEHYHKYGMAEGLNPSNAFDELAYLDAKLVQLVSTDPTNWTGKTALDVRSAFQTAGLSALEHFMLYGKAENLVAIEVPADKQVTVPSDFHIFGGQGGMPSAGFDLTRGSDNLTGTAGNDSFFAADANGFQTLNVTDTLNGGAGEDTLYIGNGAGAANFAGASIKSIEKVVSTGSVDVSANADVLNVTIQGNGIATTKMAQAVTLQNATNGNVLGANFVDATGRDDAVSVDVKSNTNMTSLTINNIEKLTLNLTGDNVMRLGSSDVAATFEANALKELVVTGEGSVKLDAAAGSGVGASNSISLLDFSANKGGAEVALATGNFAKEVTVTGGAGNDSVTDSAVSTSVTMGAIKFDVDMGAGNDKFEVNQNVKKGSVIKGGEGTDTLVLDQVTTTDDFGKMFESFENVALKAGGGSTNYTGSHFKGVSSVAVMGGDNGTFVIDEVGYLTLTDGAGIDSSTVDSLTVTGSKSLDITLDNMQAGKAAGAGISVTALSAVTAEQITIHSDGYNSTGNLIDDITATDATLTKITINGDQDLTIGQDASGAASTWTSVAGLAEINASDLSGKLTINVSGSSMTSGDKIVGGSDDDTFVVGTNNYLIKLFGGEGNDTFNVSDAKLASGTTGFDTKMIVIDDFKKGDVIDFDLTSNDFATTNLIAKAAEISGVSGLDAALVALCYTASGASAGTKAQVSWFSDGTNSYITLNQGAANDVTNDVVVKLAGLKDLDGITLDTDTGEISWA